MAAGVSLAHEIIGAACLSEHRRGVEQVFPKLRAPVSVVVYRLLSNVTL